MNAPPSRFLICLSLFSSFCCLRLAITISGFDIERVKLLSGTSLYKLVAALLLFPLSFCRFGTIIFVSSEIRSKEKKHIYLCLLLEAFFLFSF
jgi:hypothetical protein